MRFLVLALLVATSARAAIDVGGGVKRTARAVRTAVTKRGLDGDVWLGKLRGVGGRRDTLIYVPSAIDPERTIDVVIYMEGIGSFADDAMDKRHVASITRLRGNFVYVSPDAPSSTHGVRAATTEHWQAGCADQVCPGGRAAPGDFLVFLDEVRTKIATTTKTDRAALDIRVSLIGFSRGGKGALAALEQLAAAKFKVAGLPVKIADVIFADGNYLENSLTRSWEILGERGARMTILVNAGSFTNDSDDNRRRALLFWRAAAPGASEPTEDGEASAPRLRLVPLRGGHFAIGDAAVDFLGRPEAMARAT